MLARMILSLQERADQLARSKDVLLGDIGKKKQRTSETILLLEAEMNDLTRLHAKVLTS